MKIAAEVLIILLLILINGMFSMYELAMVSVKKPKLEQQKLQGDKKAEKTLQLLEHPNKFLSTVQIGISLISILSGAFGGASIAEQFSEVLVAKGMLTSTADALALGVVVLSITFFSIVIGELIPKRIALNNPEGVAKGLSGFMGFLSSLSSPIISLLDISTELGIKLLGIKPSSEPTISEEELILLIAEGRNMGVFNKAEQDFVEGVFRFTERRVDALMTPKNDIDWLDLDDSRQQLLAEIKASRFSRLPLAKGDLDKIIGVIDVKDIAGMDILSEEVKLDQLAREPLYVPENTSALKAFESFRKSGIHEAMVIDEYGSIIGMVTLFDVLESIVGDIPSNQQDQAHEVVRRADGSWSLDGLLPIDELKEIIEVETLPDEDKAGYQTLSGLVMNQLGDIPKIGQLFELEGFKFEVIDMDRFRVDRVLVTRSPQDEESEN